MSNQEQEPIALSDLSDKKVDRINRKAWLNEQYLAGKLQATQAQSDRAADALKRLDNGETGARRMIYDGSDIFQFKVPASMIDSVHRAVLNRKIDASKKVRNNKRDHAGAAKFFKNEHTDQLASIAEREMKASQEQADDEVA